VGTGAGIAAGREAAACRVAGRPRLLFLAHLLPYPPDSGASIRAFHLMRQLARRYEVHALCFDRREGGGGAERAAALAAATGAARVETFPIPQRERRMRLAWDHAQSVLAGRAYTAFAYESAAFRARLGAMLADTAFDLVHVDSLDLCAYLPDLAGQRVVCGHHNVESRLLRRRADAGRTAVHRAYLRLQAQLIAREERKWCPRLQLNIAVSEEELRALLEVAPGARVVVVPNGVDTEAYRPATTGGTVVASVGGLDWQPNRDALEHFCEAVLPRLRRLRPDARVRWIGRASRADQHAYRQRHAVELTGHVDRIQPWLADAGCFIVPLRIGGGTRLKITTAWALGMAVVSTTVGCEGLGAVDGENILVRDTPAGFAEAVDQVLQDEALRRRLGAAGRETVEQHYGWDAIGSRMLVEYEAATPSDGRR